MHSSVHSPGNLQLYQTRHTMKTILADLDLETRITIENIENALLQSSEITDSMLLLGLCARAIEADARNGLESLVLLLIEWKNALPSEHLGGLSPYEYEIIYPRGEFERGIIEDLVTSYLDTFTQHSLRQLCRHPAQSFALFNASFLELIPAYQPYEEAARPLTYRQIIEEERRQLGLPSHFSSDIGVEPFALRTSLDVGAMTEGVWREYHTVVDSLMSLPFGKSAHAKLTLIVATLKRLEPFMRFTSHAAFFYLHYGAVLEYLGDHAHADEIIEEALALDPSLTDHFATGSVPSSIRLHTPVHQQEAEKIIA